MRLTIRAQTKDTKVLHKDNKSRAKACIYSFGRYLLLLLPAKTNGVSTICRQKPKIPVGNSNGTVIVPLFPFQPKWPEKSCTICKLPLDPVHFRLFSRLSTLQMQPLDLLLFSSSRERLGPGETPHRENPVPFRAFYSYRSFRANGKRLKTRSRCYVTSTGTERTMENEVSPSLLIILTTIFL